MTGAMSSVVRSNITKIAVAGVLIATSTAAVSVPAHSAQGLGGTPSTLAVLPAPLPADPPTDVSQPPPPPPPAQPPGNEYTGEEWWPYAGTGSF